MGIPISRRVIGGLFDTRLHTLGSRVTVYRGEVDGKPPLIQTSDGPDASGRVGKYVVVYTGGGNPIIEEDLAQDADELDFSCTTTVVAGYDEDCGDLYDAVHDQLYRWTPTPPEGSGWVFGRVRHPDGFDPGPIRAVRYAGVPTRFELSAEWRLHVTTS